jgi:hypothetical protein
MMNLMYSTKYEEGGVNIRALINDGRKFENL